MNKIFNFYLIFIVFISCNKYSKYEMVEIYLNEKSALNINNFDFMIVINEMGSCMNCNDTFSKLMAKYVNQNNVLFLLCSDGQRIDVSDYLELDNKNLITDFNNDFGKLEIVENSAIIKFKEKCIDTIIRIEPKTINHVQIFLDTSFSIIPN